MERLVLAFMAQDIGYHVTIEQGHVLPPEMEFLTIQEQTLYSLRPGGGKIFGWCGGDGSYWCRYGCLGCWYSWACYNKGSLGLGESLCCKAEWWPFLPFCFESLWSFAPYFGLASPIIGCWVSPFPLNFSGYGILLTMGWDNTSMGANIHYS